MSETMTPETGSGELSVDEAASRFLGLMDPGQESTQDDPNQETQPEQEAQASEEIDEVSEEELSEEQEELEEEPQRYRVKAAGEEREVTLDELIKGYQLGSDVTKKTQLLAEDRRALEQEREAIAKTRAIRDQYAARLPMIEKVLMQNQPDVSPAELSRMEQEDPIGYAVAVARQAQRDKQIAHVRAEQNRIAQEQQAEQAEIRQKVLAYETEKLHTELPEFSDPQKAPAIHQKLREYAKSLGYEDDVLNNVIRSTDVRVLYNSMRFEELMAAKPTVTKRVAEAPKMLKAGASRQGTAAADDMKRLKGRLQRTGRVDDAAKIFEQFL